MKLVSLPDLLSGYFYPPRNIRVSHSAAGRIISMTNSSDIIGNRIRDLPPCTAVSWLPREATSGLQKIASGVLMEEFLYFCYDGPKLLSE